MESCTCIHHIARRLTLFIADHECNRSRAHVAPFRGKASRPEILDLFMRRVGLWALVGQSKTSTTVATPLILCRCLQIMTSSFGASYKKHLSMKSRPPKVTQVMTGLNILAALFAISFQCAAIAAYDDKFTVCDSETFGTPNPNDCAQAMFWIPYINAPASQSPDARAMRVFSELQYQNPPFKDIIKTQKFVPRGIEQVPRIWKYGTWVSSATFTSVKGTWIDQVASNPGSCAVALVTQPYGGGWPGSPHPTIRGEFVGTWEGYNKMVGRVQKKCLQQRTLQGGYTPWISK